MDALPVGKLPAHLLRELLKSIPHGEDVIVGPGIGRDAAAVRVDGGILVLKTDPITFPTDEIGSYLVHINANDIACMGANPRWLLVTALLPEGKTTPELVEGVFANLRRACDAVGCSLIGGHTEITEGLDRPILVGQMIGFAEEGDLINPASATPGDAVMLAGGIAIEGVSILANECAERLSKLIDGASLQRARRFHQSPGISVVPYARRLSSATGLTVKAMHDPTEGGLATGLFELAESTGLGIRISADAVYVYPETVQITEALGLDPWGLIASGALLFVVAPGEVELAINALDDEGTPVRRIGSLTEHLHERTLDIAGRTSRIPEFAVDEIARFFAES